MNVLRSLVAAGALALLACVPADEEIGFGSVQFAFVQSTFTTFGLTADQTSDHFKLSIDRVVLGFKTMTVGKIGTPDLCSYTGRGAASDVVFDTKSGVVQTFNGISPVSCPDVGVIFGPVDNETVPATGTSADELIELDQGGFHAMVDATATAPDAFNEDGTITQPVWKIQLRFEPGFTSTRFGGCREAAAGVHIVEGKRQSLNMVFAAENFFREAISTSADFRIEPFTQADALGNDDGIVTMDELDNLPLSQINGDFYELPSEPGDGDIKSIIPSLGDFVRFLFRFTVLYKSENGLCVGNAPGSTTP